MVIAIYWIQISKNSNLNIELTFNIFSVMTSNKISAALRKKKNLTMDQI